jgi:hypothetical protein
MAGFRISNPSVQFVPPAGQEEWTSNAGSFTWVVPNGVYGISAVCIGGGGGGAGTSASIGISGGGGGSYEGDDYGSGNEDDNIPFVRTALSSSEKWWRFG